MLPKLSTPWLWRNPLLRAALTALAFVYEALLLLRLWMYRNGLITTFRPVPAGTEGAISVEGTLASAAGSVLMTLVLFALQLLPSLAVSAVVMLIGFVATLAESLLGALAQDRVAWLSNELVNAMQTTLAALLAIVVLVRWM